MGKRDSKAAKAKRAERRGETRAHAEAKASKSDAKRDKREANKKDEEDLDAILAEFKAMQAKEVAVKEEVVPPPSPRANCSLTVHPVKEELLLYGGERFDGKKNIFYSELFRYNLKKNEWKKVSSPTAPPPRSSHQAVGVPSGGGSLFIYGGEFSSANQSQFHHYRDFWCLDLTTLQWEQITAKNGPSARSGHRMVLCRDQLLVFGGFFDNLREVKYYNDLHLFDLSLYKWTRVTPEPGAPVPSPRSGFQLAADPAGGVDGAGVMYLYGGYFKKQVKMQQFDSHKDKSQVEELSDTGIEYRDLWSFDLGTKAWDTLKKSGTAPSSRSGYCMTLHKKRLIVFGGVHDEDTPDRDDLISEFYNDLHAYNLEMGKWHELSVSASRKAGKAAGKKAGGKASADEVAVDGAADADDLDSSLLMDGGGRRRNRNRKDEGDDEPPLHSARGAAADAGEAGRESGAASAKSQPVAATADASEAATTEEAPAFGPCARMSASAALRGNTFFVYGGLVEPEESSQLNLSDLWALDLAKLDGWNCLYEGEAPETSLVKEDDSEDDSDDEGDEDESDEDEDEDDDDDESDEDEEMFVGNVKVKGKAVAVS